MAKEAKKLVDVKPGDKYTVIKTVQSVTIDMDSVQLRFDDGSLLRSDLASDPAIMIEK